jgi:hypothetical protein
MGGRRGKAVMPVFEGCDPCLLEAQVVRDNLGAIGIDVKIRQIPSFGAVLEPGAPFDLIDGGAEILYPDPAEFLDQMLLQNMPPSWLPAGVQSDVERIAGMSGPDREAAAISLADRLAANEVPLAAVGTAHLGTVLGARLGCRVFPPFGYGVDLAALCLEGTT